MMTGLSEAVLARDPRWTTSTLWRSEFRNILAGYLHRGALDRDALDRCLRGAESPLPGHEYLVPSDLVMRKVQASGCSAYDCGCVALADDLGTTFVACYKQILREIA